MTERAERINGWAAMCRSSCSNGFLCRNRSDHPWHLVMLVFAASMVAGFVVASLLRSDDDDDSDGPDGGILTPIAIPT